MGTENTTTDQRLFFALWPERAEQRRLHDIGREVLGAHSGKIVSPESIHMTLVFLGTLPAQRLPQVRDIAAQTPWDGVSLCFDRIGWFRRARVLWAGCSNAPETLVNYVGMLQDRLRDAGMNVDRRTFQPHITLARKVRRPPLQREMDPLVCRFDRLFLVRSVLDPGGSHYVNVASWPDPGEGGGEMGSA
jgi:2'-5' RNA ligase